MGHDTITEPGVYELPEWVYHGDPVRPGPSLSASIGKILLAKTPMHAAYEHPILNPEKKPTNKRAFDIGHAAHQLMLGKGKGFRMITAVDKDGEPVTTYATKAAKEERQAAWDAGEIPLLEHERPELMDMYHAGRKQLEGFVASGDVPIYPFSEGKPEQALVWVEKTRFGDVWCRSLFDWLPDRIDDLYDYKTTAASANPADWSIFQMRKLGFTFQAAFYRRAVRALTLAYDPNFRFIVHESKPPYALSVIGVDPDELEEADKDVQRVIDIWGKCVSTNNWPGYPPFVVVPERSDWMKERDAERRNLRESHDHLSSEDIAASL